ncbi:DnaJ protein (chromatophore) [Paulinella micropora]|uniref:DnaJ protein n=1 Tax=Paulinella micropora TaxID=1928728 RepID=A0A1L5YBW3_9EUKA|nr:DnaJ protein [Paulinella micropora]AQX44962.1 DnaJ protein [Paulinella micropora]BBL86176.1 DnaJ protein [Paulinella micropora]
MADYYSVLGVSRDADSETIKKAYRRMARKYHPDINKEPGAEDRFKEASRAYEVLSDPQTRNRYDQFGEAGVSGGGTPNTGDVGGFADLFETFFSGFGGTAAGGRTGGAQKGDDLRLDFTVDFNEAIFGQEREVQVRHLEVCSSCRGTGAKVGSGPTDCTTCNGAGQVRRAMRTPLGSFAQIVVCPTCEGNGQIITDPCQSCSGQGVHQVRKKLLINIPPGVDTGVRLRISNEGNAGVRGGPSGDLYVFVTVKPHATLRREGTNLLSEVNINYLQAILGDCIEVETVDGPETLEIIPGTQPGKVLNLIGKGVPKLGNPVAKGNHLVTIKVQLPTKVSTEERYLLEQLAGHHSAKGHSQKSGLFGGFFR